MAKEFVSEEEMRECLGEDARGYWGNYGYIHASHDTENNEEPVAKKVEIKNYFVGAYINGGIFYISENGATYIKSQAKAFTKIEAEKKASAMSKKGNYVWEAIRKS